ncbi:MAG: AcrR family transcriptional regulator [Limisphaerales bacterium]|jgi:AcrR family transcriptional regulator
MQKKVDSRRTRSEATKTALMRAAEKLIAEHGMEHLSIREITSTAGQKNESALQYHFKNITGLIDAILLERSQQIHEVRAQKIETLIAQSPEPSLREICMLMVAPAFDLARSNIEFHRYIMAFGHELVLTDTSPLSKVTTRGGGGGGKSGRETGRMLRNVVPHLDADAYQRRLEAAVRLCSASMYYQARQKSAFKGHQAELFLHNLVDALVGLFSAPISEETQALTAKRTRKP